MILTKTSFRTLKTALMQIEGHPGSARLGEALARGLGFPDYHALKTELDKTSGMLSWVPEPVETDMTALLAALEDIDDQVRRDIVATFFYHVEGAVYFEEPDDEPETTGGRVRLEYLMPLEWRENAAKYLPGALAGIGCTSIRYAVLDGDRRHVERFVDGSDEPVEFSEEELAIFYGEHDPDAAPLNLFLEGAFVRAREALPDTLRGKLTHVVADAQGVRAVIETLDSDGAWEFVLLNL